MENQSDLFLSVPIENFDEMFVPKYSPAVNFQETQQNYKQIYSDNYFNDITFKLSEGNFYIFVTKIYINTKYIYIHRLLYP